MSWRLIKNTFCNHFNRATWYYLLMYKLSHMWQTGKKWMKNGTFKISLVLPGALNLKDAFKFVFCQFMFWSKNCHEQGGPSFQSQRTPDGELQPSSRCSIGYRLTGNCMAAETPLTFPCLWNYRPAKHQTDLYQHFASGLSILVLTDFLDTSCE